jgi:signal transduction histidine kinase
MGYLREDAHSGNMPRLDSDINRIGEGAEKMLRLINELIDLMSVGRIAQDFTEFPLSELVDEALDQLREKTAQKHITVYVADDLPRVRGDRKRLLEVFQNLLDNSIKFMGDQPEARIEIGMRKVTDGSPVFYVGDNGIGIEQRFHERIFGIFHKLDARSEGTGIGLALVKRIIEYHGGRIWVESDGLGKGVIFCFTIPDRMKAD